jgi:hypothetical protein
MIDLNALDNDPWATFPAKKEDLRALAAALQGMEKELQQVMIDARKFYAVLSMIASQNEEPASRDAARRIINYQPQTGLII